MNITRRAFLGGLLTLAAVPQLHALPNGLTPLEHAVENLRQAYLRQLLFGGPAETWSVAKAVQAHRELGLSGRDRIMTLRLAFRMARRDYQILRLNPPPVDPAEWPLALTPTALNEICERRLKYLMTRAS